MPTRVPAMAVLAFFVFTACAERGPAGKDGASAVVKVGDEPPGERCPNGGKRLETSVAGGPVTTSYLCHGTGQPGDAAAVVVSDEPAGSHCPNGGKKLETSVGAGPVTTSFLCNGEPGAASVAVSEPPGIHCAAGGVKVTTASGDAFVCNGQDVTATTEPPGTTCPAGGVKVTGASSTAWVCNGESPTLTVAAEPPGDNCPTGGQKVTASSQGGTTTAYVCNGAAQRVALTPEPPGAHCPAGGFRLVAYADLNGNGLPDPAEVAGLPEQYLCNGAPPDGGLPAAACTGAYEALQWDGTQWRCVKVNGTGPSGGKARGFEVVDSWGTAWDGVERMPATWANAKAACEAAGGRLPTATEVWRVGASQFSDVGTAYETNWLWTLTPWHTHGATQQHALGKLTDAGGDSAIGFDNDTAKYAYRCAWPPAALPGFSGNRCYGPAGSACFKGPGEGGRMNLDRYDRPSLSYAGATWECAFYGAHLPVSLGLAEAILSGLPNGSNAWLWTADHSKYDNADLVRWTGTNPAGWNATYPSYWSWAPRSNTTSGANNRYRFRCMGDGVGTAPHTGGLAGDVASWGASYTGKSTSLVGHEKNLAAAKWEEAVSDCFARGGQLPHTRDWMELIRDGLPGGAGAAGSWVWSSDMGYLSYAQVVQWAAVDKDFTGYYPQYGTWGATGAQAYPYRCTWYPLDVAYTGPGKCFGGQLECHLAEKNAAGPPVRTWADPADRLAATWAAAVKTCASEGGHLASVREYVALVRDGLPNGMSSWLWTSDSEGTDGANPALAGLFKWGGGQGGTQVGWTTALGNTSWAYRDAATAYGYRCVWSNQLW